MDLEDVGKLRVGDLVRVAVPVVGDLVRVAVPVVGGVDLWAELRTSELELPAGSIARVLRSSWRANYAPYVKLTFDCGIDATFDADDPPPIFPFEKVEPADVQDVRIATLMALHMRDPAGYPANELEIDVRFVMTGSRDKRRN